MPKRTVRKYTYVCPQPDCKCTWEFPLLSHKMIWVYHGFCPKCSHKRLQAYKEIRMEIRKDNPSIERIKEIIDVGPKDNAFKRYRQWKGRRIRKRKEAMGRSAALWDVPLPREILDGCKLPID